MLYMFFITRYFRKLYNALPIFGPVPYSMNIKYRNIYSLVFFCKTYKLNKFLRLLVFFPALLLWYLKAIKIIYREIKLNSRKIRNSEGISFYNQLKKLLNLAFIKNVSPNYYYYLQLYKRKFVIGEDYLINSQIFPILGYLSKANVRNTLNNKFEFFLRMRREIKNISDLVAVVTNNEIKFFNSLQEFPPNELFIKPINGAGGRDCHKITYLGNSQYSIDYSEEILDKNKLESYLKNMAKKEDFVLQSIILNHTNILQLSNGNLPTCRITSFKELNDNIFILFAIFMMPIDQSLTSNTHGIGAAVNLSTGALSKAINLEDPFFDIEIHPQGRGKINGFVLPFWEESKNVCINAHHQFRELPIIAWDVAFTPDGPLIIEGNLIWDLEYWQLTHQETFRPDELMSLLEKHLKINLGKY